MKKSEALHRLLALSGPYRFLLIGALVLSALQVMMTLWAPVVIGQTLDVIAVKGQGNFAVVMRHLVMLAMIVSVCVRVVSECRLCPYCERLAQAVLQSVSSSAAQHAGSGSAGRFHEHVG